MRNIELKIPSYVIDKIGIEHGRKICDDYFKMDMTFDSDVTGLPEPTTVDFDATTTGRLTLGLALNYVIGNAFAEYNFASTSSFAFGLTIGK